MSLNPAADSATARQQVTRTTAVLTAIAAGRRAGVRTKRPLVGAAKGFARKLGAIIGTVGQEPLYPLITRFWPARKWRAMERDPHLTWAYIRTSRARAHRQGGPGPRRGMGKSPDA